MMPIGRKKPPKPTPSLSILLQNKDLPSIKFKVNLSTLFISTASVRPSTPASMYGSRLIRSPMSSILSGMLIWENLKQWVVPFAATTSNTIVALRPWQMLHLSLNLLTPSTCWNDTSKRGVVDDRIVVTIVERHHHFNMLKSFHEPTSSAHYRVSD